MKRMVERIADFDTVCPVCKKMIYKDVTKIKPFHARNARDWCHSNCAESLQKVTIIERKKHVCTLW